MTPIDHADGQQMTAALRQPIWPHGRESKPTSPWSMIAKHIELYEQHKPKVL
jgi:hypothetical protein